MHLQHNFAALGQPFFSFTSIQPLAEQQLVHYNQPLAQELGIDFSDPATQAILSGNSSIENSLSMVYAGHQFGGFSPQLGDGRGVLLGELKSQNGLLYDLHMKGAGLTPYSRQGDGRAVLRSCMREYLASEAMAALNIASSRALALYDSQEPVYREQIEKGAMLLRTARTHIRFGHFEFFFYRKQQKELDQLIDYCLNTYFPECLQMQQPLVSMLEHVVDRTALMIAKWQAIGFQHGVMNTDNMSLWGETMDYGPYEFMDIYQPKKIFNHSDYEGRYVFERQPGVALWNLNCLLRCFSNHLERPQLVAILSTYEEKLQEYYQQEIEAKLGISLNSETDNSLIAELFTLLDKEQLDHTLFFRTLSQMPRTDGNALMVDVLGESELLTQWLGRYQSKREQEHTDWQTTSLEMQQSNPKFILRNYLAQTAIARAEQGDYVYFQQLLQVLQRPYDEQPEFQHFAQLPPDWSRDLSISCSS
ncbi:YdiU family protein [Marinomonas agarivorans]|nr:YdiU family protein [Marinomonas agarivorans]